MILYRGKKALQHQRWNTPSLPQLDLSCQLLHSWLPRLWYVCVSAVRRTRPFSTKQTSGCRQKEKPQNPSLLRLCLPLLPPKEAAEAPTWTRWQQSISILLKHKVPGKALQPNPTKHLGWPQIKLNSAARSPLLPSFPPFLFWSKNCLLWLLSTTCVWFDRLLPACACLGGRPHPSFPSLCTAANKGGFVGTFSALDLVGIPVLLS